MRVRNGVEGQLGRRVKATCTSTNPTHPRTTSNRADPHTQFVGTHRSTKQPHTPPVTPTTFAPTKPSIFLAWWVQMWWVLLVVVCGCLVDLWVPTNWVETKTYEFSLHQPHARTRGHSPHFAYKLRGHISTNLLHAQNKRCSDGMCLWPHLSEEALGCRCLDVSSLAFLGL